MISIRNAARRLSCITCWLSNCFIHVAHAFAIVRRSAARMTKQGAWLLLLFACAPTVCFSANGSMLTATAVSLNSTVTQATTSAQPADYFQFTVPAGKVSVNFKHADAGTTNALWNIAVLNGASTQYLSFSPVGTTTDQTLSVDLPAGTYYVKINDNYYGGSFDKEYQLTLSSSTGNYEIEPNETIATATPIALNTAYSGIVQSKSLTDVDYFKFTVPAGKVSLNFKHADAGTTNALWNIAVLDAASTQYLSFASVGTTTDQTLGVDLPAGTYYVKINDNYYGGSFDKEYQLTLSSTTGNYEIELNDTIATATPIALNTAYSGSIQSKSLADVDYYQFSVPTSRPFMVDFRHASIGTTNNIWNIRVLDGANKQYLNLDSAGSVPDLSYATAQLTAGTNYFVKVSDYYGQSVNLEYQLTVFPDTVPPVTTVSSAGGMYNTIKSVTLACGDGTQSGCDKMYFTTDGSTPTSASSVYTTPISIAANTVLKFFATDLAGNSEAVKTESYIIDTLPPTTTVLPAGGAYKTTTSVALACSDGTGTGCNAIYYTTNGSWPTSSSTLYTTPISIAASTTLNYFSKDLAGNSEAVKTQSYTIDSTAPRTYAPAGGTSTSDSVVWSRNNAQDAMDIQNGVVSAGDLIIVVGGKVDPYASDVISGNIKSISTGSTWTENFDGFITYCYNSAAMGWPCDYTFNGVASSVSNFVAVGQQGSIRTASSLIPNEQSGTTQDLKGVSWSSTLSKFVVVGANGTILSSPDGSAWTSVLPAITNETLYGVASAGTKLVAVGSNGKVLISSDGAAWSSAASGTQNSLHGVAWSPTLSLFVAVGDGGVILTSADGSAWSPRDTRTFDDLHGVAASDTQVVAVGANGTVLSSLDGVIWKRQSTGISNNLRAVAWSGTKFVVVGDSGMVLTGVETSTHPLASQNIPITCNDGLGSGCDKIYYTTDGTTPTTASAVYTGPIAISATTTLKFFAVDMAGNSEAVNTEVYAIVATATAVPGAPTAISAAAGDAQATVSFSPPLNDGGSAITSYAVTATPGGVTAAGVASPIVVAGLSNGTDYSFTATATNAVGTGPASAASNAVTPAAPTTSTSTSTTTTATTTSTTVLAVTTTTTTTSTTTTQPSTSTTTVASTTTTTRPGAVSISFIPGWNLVGNGVEAPITVANTFNDASTVTTIWKWVASGSTQGISYPAWAFYTPMQNDGGQTYAATKGYDFLTTINPGEGFWVNAKTAFTTPLPSAAAVQSSSFMPAVASPATAGGAHALPHGWSLIATGDSQTPEQFDAAIGTLLSTPPAAGSKDVYTNLTTLWAWDATHRSWYFWAPSLANSGGLAGYIGSKGYLDFANMPTTPTGTVSPATGFWVNMP